MNLVASLLLSAASVTAPDVAAEAAASPSVVQVAQVSAPVAPSSVVAAPSAPAGSPATGTLVAQNAPQGAAPSPVAAEAAGQPVVVKAAPVVVRPEDTLMEVERRVVAQTNAERMRRGLPGLQVDPRLMNSARRHAQWMASRRSMQHGRAAVAENIAAGQSTAGEVVRDWMNSAGHRANILNSRHSRIGVAAYQGADGQIYWCQQFLW